MSEVSLDCHLEWQTCHRTASPRDIKSHKVRECVGLGSKNFVNVEGAILDLDFFARQTNDSLYDRITFETGKHYLSLRGSTCE